LKTAITRISLALCFLVAIAFSLKNLREPDLWWQIRTGEWILENGQVPRQDVFSYTYEGAPWINIKWGFEVVAAMISSALGPENIFLLQALVSCLLLWVLYKTARQSARDKGLDETIFAMVIPVVMLAYLVASAYRIIGRPEMISHLLTAVFLMLLLEHQRSGNRKILLLVPLQILWANFHEAFATGWVIVIIFTAGAWIEWYLSKKKLITKQVAAPRILSTVSALCIAGVMINPYGIALLESPAHIFGQVFENKFTTELLSFTSYLYWKQEAYIAAGLLVVALAGLLSGINRRSKEKWYLQPVSQHGISVFILIAAFTYLALTAYRNIILLDIILFPYVMLAIVTLLQRFSTKRFVSSLSIALPFITLIAAAGLYISIVSNVYYKYAETNDTYGLEVLSTNNPDGAASYIEQKGLGSKRAFSDYLTSSYLLWKLQPGFKTFIDLRDLDVFPPAFFQRAAQAFSDPSSFNSIDSQYHFDYIVLFRPEFEALHQYLYSDSSWSLGYADAVAMVYERTAHKQNAGFSLLKPVTQSSLARAVSKLFNPFYKPYDYSMNDEDQFAAMYHMAMGNEAAAREDIARSMNRKTELHIPYTLYGKLFMLKAFKDTSVASRMVLLDSAQQYFKRAIKEEPMYSDAYLGLGEIAYEQQYYKEAVKQFEKSIRYNSANLDASLYLAQTYKMMANQKASTEQQYLKAAISNYEHANRVRPNNPIIEANLGFLYFRVNDCSNAVPYLERVQDYPGLSEQERQSVKNCLAKCR
jgi:tetratricopeptide (TPR) repeat protein